MTMTAKKNDGDDGDPLHGPPSLRRRRTGAVSDGAAAPAASGSRPSRAAMRAAVLLAAAACSAAADAAHLPHPPPFSATNAAFVPASRSRPFSGRTAAAASAAQRRSPAAALHMGSSDIADAYANKWDNLSDDDDDDGNDDDYYDVAPPSQRVPPDMRYEMRNIHRQSNNYDALRDAGGRDVVSDVYLRSPGDEMAWLVGRVASVSDVLPPRAIDRQFPLIERHGWLLRPVDLHPRRGPFEVWYTAVGEMDESVLACDSSVQFVRIEEDDVKVDDTSKQDVKASEVGFKAVAYDDGDEHVGARLTADGRIVAANGKDFVATASDFDFGDSAAPTSSVELELDGPTEDVLDKMKSAATLEDLLDDTDFQDLMDKM